jgi:hypothetical protein
MRGFTFEHDARVFQIFLFILLFMFTIIPEGVSLGKNFYISANMSCTCPAGSTYSHSTKRCEIPPSCPSEGTWNSSLKKCVASPQKKCEILFAVCGISGGNVLPRRVELRCNNSVEPSYCEGQLFAGSLGSFYCYVDTKATYSVRGFFPVQRPYCNALLPAQFMTPIGYSIAIITVDARMVLRDICPKGYSLSQNICEALPSCPSGFTYDPEKGLCFIVPPDCPSGATFDYAQVM